MHIAYLPLLFEFSSNFFYIYTRSLFNVTDTSLLFFVGMHIMGIDIKSLMMLNAHYECSKKPKRNNSSFHEQQKFEDFFLMDFFGCHIMLQTEPQIRESMFNYFDNRNSLMCSVHCACLNSTLAFYLYYHLCIE